MSNGRGIDDGREAVESSPEAVGMAKSSYYYCLVGQRKPQGLDESLVKSISEVRQGYAKVCGHRKVTMALRVAGWTVNINEVLRHLHILGLTQPRKLKGCKLTRPGIVRPVVCNTYWEADLTYVWVGSANTYLFVVIDARDRDIVGDVFSDRCRAREVVEALEKAGED